MRTAAFRLLWTPNNIVLITHIVLVSDYEVEITDIGVSKPYSIINESTYSIDVINPKSPHIIDTIPFSSITRVVNTGIQRGDNFYAN